MKASSLNITIIDGYSLNPGDNSWQRLEQYGNVHIFDHTPDELIIPRCVDSDIVITNKVPFTAQTLDQLPKLRLIVVTATGYNIIDTAAARSHGITVCNAPNYSTPAVAQHVFGMLLHIATRVGDYANDNRHGAWPASPDFCLISYPTVELQGKTLGIYGLGNIGQKVAQIAHAFDMNIIALTSKHPEQLPYYITPVGKSEFLALSDVITLHVPLTSSTRHFINSDSLSQMKQGAILVNTARGPLVDEDAVAAALHQGRLSAYCADVLSTEPPSADNPLLHAPNSFITPHVAWATLQAQQRLTDITIQNVISFIQSTPTNTVF